MKEIWDNENDEVWNENFKSLIIGITGSIGSGKTTAAKMFSEHHYSRIDADEISHYLMEKDKLLKN